MRRRKPREANTRIMDGNAAAAEAAKLCRVQVIAAYPITPQSPVTEVLSEFVERGDLNAEYVTVESEHSAMAVCSSASMVGARTFTASSSHGLAYMHEMLHWVAGTRLPVVLACVNRAIGAPWNVLNDQQDSISQRDTGWIQIYARNNQEILDSVVQAYKIAEMVYLHRDQPSQFVLAEGENAAIGFPNLFRCVVGTGCSSHVPPMRHIVPRGFGDESLSN